MRAVLGFHVGPDWAGGALDQCLESGPALLKVFQNPDPDPVLRILAKWPDTQIVVRKYFEDSEQAAFLADGRDGGRRCANLVADYYARIQVALGDRLIWLEGVNEPSPHPYDKAFAQVAEYSQGFAEVAARRGFRPAVVSLSVGQPEGDPETRRYLWGQLMPALYAAQQYGGGFACHPYSAERMDTAPEYYVLRIFEDRRMFWPADLRELPIIMSETGIDRGVLKPAPEKPDAGWRFKTSAADYADQLRWFRDKLAPDPTVVGATIFAIGITGDWHSFDVTSVPEITAVVAEQRTIKEVPVSYKVTFPNGVPDAVLGQTFEVDVAIVDEATGAIVPISGLGMAYLDVPLKDGGYTYGAIQQVAIDAEIDGADVDGRQRYRFTVPENALPPELDEGQGTLRAELISAPFTNIPRLEVPVRYLRYSTAPAPQPGPITSEPDWTTSPDRPLMDNLYWDANALEIEGTTEQAQEVGHRVVRLIDWWKSGPNGVDPFFK